MKLLQSGEDYLETILILRKRNGSVRSIDIAAELGYTKPSISRAMGILRKRGLITVDADGQIHLTELGFEKASQIYERHCIIAQYLEMTLGVEHRVAEQDACRIEHVISEESFARIKALVDRPACDNPTV